MKSSTLKICIILGILILITAVGFFVIFSIIRSKASQVANLNDQVAEKAVYATENHSLHALIGDTTPIMTELSNHIVTSTSSVAYIESLETLAKQNNLTVIVNSINNIDDQKLGSNFEWLNISLSTQGSWQSTYHFLSELQTLSYKVSLGTISFTYNAPVWATTFAINTVEQK